MATYIRYEGLDFASSEPIGVSKRRIGRLAERSASGQRSVAITTQCFDRGERQMVKILVNVMISETT